MPKPSPPFRRQSIRAVLITDSEHVILSPLQPETVANRLGNLDYDEDEGEEEDE